MKFKSTVVHPGQRARQVAAFESMAKAAGITDPTALAQLRLSSTPEPLRHLPDHAARGQKSLGRIQQINNRRRFKVRATASR